MKSYYIAAALLAVALLGSGCGGNGGGSAASPAAQNMVVESTPRSVSGVTFLQEADRATYRTGEVMHLRFTIYYAQSATEQLVTFDSPQDYQPVQWQLTDARGIHTLVPRTPPSIVTGAGAPPGQATPDPSAFEVIPGAFHGFENDAPAPAPGTYTLSAWSLTTTRDVPGLDPPASAMQTTLYANPITIRVTP